MEQPRICHSNSRFQKRTPGTFGLWMKSQLLLSDFESPLFFHSTWYRLFFPLTADILPQNHTDWYSLTFMCKVAPHCHGAALHLCTVCKQQSLKEWHLLNRTSVGADSVCFFFFFFFRNFLYKNKISQTTSTASHTICFLYLLPSKVISEDKTCR